MGKYLKKSKTSDVAVMEVSPQPSNGVRTRATKTLALQRLQRPSSSPDSVSTPDILSVSYLELRSRRLEKLPLLKQRKEQILFQQKTEQSSGCCRQRLKRSNCRPNSKLKSDSLELESVSLAYEKNEKEANFDVQVEKDCNSAGINPSFEPSILEFSVGDRSTFGTEIQRSFLTSHEIEEFFAYAEQKQQRLFIEKYNFDVVNDAPLSGRYEWVELFP